jgi:hypothetical protein
MTTTETDRAGVSRARTESPPAILKIGILDEKQNPAGRGTFDENDRRSGGFL